MGPWKSAKLSTLDATFEALNKANGSLSNQWNHLFHTKSRCNEEKTDVCIASHFNFCPWSLGIFELCFLTATSFGIHDLQLCGLLVSWTHFQIVSHTVVLFCLFGQSHKDIFALVPVVCCFHVNLQ